MEHYDYIIAGGGCAGLSLAWQLLHSPLRDRTILIVDRDDKDQNDRTWAFWSETDTDRRAFLYLDSVLLSAEGGV